MRIFNIALAMADEDLRAEIRSEVGPLPVRIILDQESFEIPQLARLRIDLVLTGDTPRGEDIGDFVRRIKAQPAPAMVGVFCRTANGEAMVEALGAGADEIIVPPFRRNIRAAVERLIGATERREEAPRPRGRAIAFLSAKGGCGATMLACHTALTFERYGRADVLLAEMDTESPVIAHLLRIHGGCRLPELLSRAHRLDAASWKRMASNVRPRLDCIPSEVVTAYQDLPRREQHREVLRSSRMTYDWIVADLGRGLNARTAALVDDFDEVFIVTTATFASLYQSREIVRRLNMRGVSTAKLKLVVNGLEARDEVDPHEVHACVGIPAAALIPALPSLERGGPLNLHSNETTPRVIGNFALRILGLPERPMKTRRWPSLLGWKGRPAMESA